MLELVCFGVNTCLAAFFYQLYKDKCKTLDLLKNAPRLEIDGQLAKQLASAPNHTIPYVVIQGAVKALYFPLQSENAPLATGVIHEKILKEHKVVWNWTSRWWYPRERVVHQSVNSVPFVLRRPDGWGKHQVMVMDHNCASNLTLTSVHEKYEPHSPGFFRFIAEFFAGERSKGLQTMEYMLTEGTVLTAVGELALKGGRVELKPPLSSAGYEYFLTSQSDEALVRQVNVDANVLGITSTILGAIAAGFLVVTVYKVYVKRRDNMERERRAFAARASQRVPREQLTEAETCTICLQNPREVIFLDCGHVCCCTNCAETLSPPRCPICREPIRRIVQAYIA